MEFALPVPVLDLPKGFVGGRGGIFSSASSSLCERRSETSGNSTANCPRV